MRLVDCGTAVGRRHDFGLDFLEGDGIDLLLALALVECLVSIFALPRVFGRT